MIALAVGLCCLGRPVTAADQPFKLGAAETVVVLGDSISCPNEIPALAYWSFLETWLRTRQPSRKLAVFNVSWPGETAAGALARFARDAAPTRPTVVWIDFGVNDGLRDGKRGPADPAMVRRFRDSMRGLIAAAKALPARPLVVSPSCVDYRDQGYVAMLEYDSSGEHVVEYAGEKGFRNNHELDAYPQYNATIAAFVDEETAIGREGLAPFIDLFHPMLAQQRALKRWPTVPSLTTDTIHPNPAGAILMLEQILKRLGLDGGSVRATIGGGEGHAAGGGRVDAVAPLADGGVRFRLALPCLPLYIPKEGRLALSLTPFEREFNDFSLRVTDWPARRKGYLFCDHRLLGEFAGTAIREGIDLALLDGAPWTARSLGLQTAAMKVADRIREVWLSHVPGDRTKGLSDHPEARIDPAIYASYHAMSESLSATARPGQYELSLLTANPVTRGPRPLVLEGWEGENVALWYTVDQIGELQMGRDAPTEGGRTLRVVLREPGEPRVTVATKCLPDLDLAGARRIAVDVRGVAKGGPFTFSFSVQAPNRTRGTVLLGAADLTTAWRTLTFPLAAVKWDDVGGSPDRLAHVSGLALTIEGAGGGLVERIDYDNLRLVE